MSGRRIRLDLSDFVLDVGSHRWMFLSDAKFATVSDLVEQLKVEYTQLEDDDLVQVFMDGDFVIPPWESIEILQSGDLLRVVKTVAKEKTKSKSKSGKGDPASDDVDVVDKKGKKTNVDRSNSRKRKQEDHSSKASKKSKVVTKQSSQGLHGDGPAGDNLDLSASGIFSPIRASFEEDAPNINNKISLDEADNGEGSDTSPRPVSEPTGEDDLNKSLNTVLGSLLNFTPYKRLSLAPSKDDHYQDLTTVLNSDSTASPTDIPGVIVMTPFSRRVSYSPLSAIPEETAESDAMVSTTAQYKTEDDSGYNDNNLNWSGSGCRPVKNPSLSSSENTPHKEVLEQFLE